MYIAGRYFPDDAVLHDDGHGGHGHPAMLGDTDAEGNAGEPYSRIVTASLGVVPSAARSGVEVRMVAAHPLVFV